VLSARYLDLASDAGALARLPLALSTRAGARQIRPEAVGGLAHRGGARGATRTTGAPGRRAAIAPGDEWRSRSRVGRSECCLDRGRGPRQHRADELSLGLQTHRVHGPQLAARRPGHRRLWRRQRHTAATKTASGRPATIGLEPAGRLGKVLVDSCGRTAYLFREDSRGKSSCATAWPPVRAQGMPVPGPGLSAAKLTTTARSNGAPQVLCSGHPLYRYTGDAKPGDTNGQRLTDFGAAWFAVSGAGQVVSRPASKPGGKSIY
jgi:predicted lipoprotein with Yx(FWY)xxD motif